MTKQEEKKLLTRAQKTEATKGLIKELLAIKFMRHNELIEEVAKMYTLRYEGENTENINDVKGRVGSVLDIMKKESEVGYDGGMYALKARLPMPRPTKNMEETPSPVPEQAAKEEEPAPKKRTRTKKAESVKAESPVEDKTEEPVPKKRTRTKKTAEQAEPAPTPDKVAEEGTEEKAEKPAPKKRTRTKKAEASTEVKTETKTEEEPAPKKEEIKAEEPVPQKAEPVQEEKAELVVKPKAEVARQNILMDMSFLFGDKTAKAAPKKEEKKAELPPAPKQETKREEKAVTPPTPVPAPVAMAKREEKAVVPKKEEGKPVQKRSTTTRGRARVEEKPLTAEEKLKESFLKKLRTLGGDYFEYYSVYLLERYSLKNGRRLEGLRVCGGDHDGGIDGEIELTDKMGFKETIYIQSKNWDPEKGRGDNWIVGETLLQQFIGACACRQAKEGKQACRGIFMTTSRFTPEAKRILSDLSEKLIGYDGDDIYEAAKECSFGLIKKNGEWTIDEHLLSGTKAFFSMI